MKLPCSLLLASSVMGCASPPAPSMPPMMVVHTEPEAVARPANALPVEAPANKPATADEIAAALAELDVATIGALGAGGLGYEGVLDSSEVPPGLLEAAGKSRASSGSSPPRAGGGVATRNLSSPPRKPKPKGPAITVVAKSSVRSGPVANTAAVVARMRARFRACYRIGLKSDPTMAGSLSLTAKLGPNGEVLGVSGSTKTSLKPIVSCFKAVIASGGFAPPGSGAAEVDIALDFALKK